jgi:hypothetical protein
VVAVSPAGAAGVPAGVGEGRSWSVPVLELVVAGALDVLEAVVDAGLERRRLGARVLVAVVERRAVVDDERLEVAAELPQPASASMASSVTTRAGQPITRLPWRGGGDRA